MGLSGSIGAATSSAIKFGGSSVKSIYQSGAITGAGVLTAGSTIASETGQGRSLGAAMVKGGASYVGHMIAPELMYGKMAAQAAVGGANAAIDFRKRRGHEIQMANYHATIGGGFQDSMQAQTMRQAAVQQIQSNKLNARSALGGEARIFSSRKHNQHTRPYL